MSDLRKIISQRLRQLRHAREWTVEETTRRLSSISSETIGPSRYGNWEQGIRAPRLEQFVELGALFGVTPAYVAGLTCDDGSGPEAERYTVPNPPTISTPAGPLSLAQGDDSLAISLELIAERGLNRSQLQLIRADDASMAGVIDSGDRVLIDLSVTRVTRDDIFALLVNGRVLLRWIRNALPSGYRLQAEDQARYPDQLLSADDLAQLTILGRVALIARLR